MAQRRRSGAGAGAPWGADVDDLALAEGARLLFGLPERPRGKAFHQMAEAWSPWRAVAARGLWAWYAVNKQREGVAP